MNEQERQLIGYNIWNLSGQIKEAEKEHEEVIEYLQKSRFRYKTMKDNLEKLIERLKPYTKQDDKTTEERT